jgi:hypothetical protein
MVPSFYEHKDQELARTLDKLDAALTIQNCCRGMKEFT